VRVAFFGIEIILVYQSSQHGLSEIRVIGITRGRLIRWFQHSGPRKTKPTPIPSPSSSTTVTVDNNHLTFFVPRTRFPKKTLSASDSAYLLLRFRELMHNHLPKTTDPSSSAKLTLPHFGIVVTASFVTATIGVRERNPLLLGTTRHQFQPRLFLGGSELGHAN